MNPSMTPNSLNPSSMEYQYSTKNFHRFQATNADAAIKEVYVPRAFMVKPIRQIVVSVQVAAYVEVPEKSKPARA